MENSTELESPGEYRLINFRNLEGSVESIVNSALCRAYRFTNGWTIHGLDDLDAGALRHLTGDWNQRATLRGAPSALTSIMFEIQPGRALGPTDEGDGFRIDRLAVGYLKKNKRSFISPQ